MLHIGRARHPGPGKRSFIPGQLSIEFANIGGWLTYGDLAMDSCAQFLAVAEHRLIPARCKGNEPCTSIFTNIYDTQLWPRHCVHLHA